jgi:hypothetical protein
LFSRRLGGYLRLISIASQLRRGVRTGEHCAESQLTLGLWSRVEFVL